MMKKIKGIPTASGLAIGRAYLLYSEELSAPKRKIQEKDLPKEVMRFEEALIKTRAEIIKIQTGISRDMGSEHAEIFAAHLLVLEDRVLIEEVVSRLKKEKLSVDYVFLEVLKKYTRAFSRIDDAYLKERLSDIDDVGKRILRNLQGINREELFNLGEKVIVVAYDLSPSDTASMRKENVMGFITDIGGRTSHTAIMAKALEITAVVGLEKATSLIKDGDTLIVDGTHGIVIINPNRSTVERYRKDKEKIKEAGKGLEKLKNLPPQTLDGHRVELAANIELPEEISSVLAHGGKGIGLYRTEFFYMNRSGLPTEDEHYEAYKRVAMEMAPHPVIIRTLDLGGDKFLSQLKIPHEMNPYLGWRAIRFCLARPDVFKTQLRAILRASVHGELKFMYPMISGVEELRDANQILEQAKEELRIRKVPFNDNIEVGAMIEIPSAALTCDILAKEVSFFSIGTNDLIQYSLAVDRANEKIAYLYEPTHPAVLRLIKNIIDAGHEEGIWVGMCGEMAGEPTFALLLLGLGLDKFSTSPVMIPKVKKVIRSVSLVQAQQIAKECLSLSTGKEVKRVIEKKLAEIIPDMEK